MAERTRSLEATAKTAILAFTWLSLMLLTMRLAEAANSQEPQQIQHQSMPQTTFYLYANAPAESQVASEAFCRRNHLEAVNTREVRYFWKQLPYNISFYLGSRIEMTTDHPEIERGEVLCFPLKRINVATTAAAAYDALHALHKISATSPSGSGGSCRISVSSVLCKRQLLLGGNCSTATDQLQPPPLGPLTPSKQGKQDKQEEGGAAGHVSIKSADGSVCLSAPLFWTLTSGTGTLLLLLTAAAITLAACSIRLKRQLNSSFGYQCLSRQASARLMMHPTMGAVVKHSAGGSHISGAALDTEDGGGFFL